MSRILLTAALALISVPATAQDAPAHKLVDPASIQWGAAPAALPRSPMARRAMTRCVSALYSGWRSLSWQRKGVAMNNDE